jgi:large subunit ribosomal protein L22
VRIRGDRLKTMAEERGFTPETLGAAITRKGLDEQRAAAAVRNWMRGTDHPRCKAEDIRAMARALGCEVGELSRFTSVYRFARGSERKASLLTDLIRGKSFQEAENLLTFTTKRAAVDVKKALMAAFADADQAGADKTALVVAESRVDGGPIMKRFQPKDLKRMSHITVGLEERA